MRPDVVEPALRPAVADPAVLAELCGVDVAEVGPVSPRGLELSAIEANRATLGTTGQGTAHARYTPTNGGTICEGGIDYDFEQPEGNRPLTIRNLRVVR